MSQSNFDSEFKRDPDNVDSKFKRDLTKTDPALKRDLEHRIKTIESLNDAELGSFKWFDWSLLILVALIIPVIVIEMAR